MIDEAAYFHRSRMILAGCSPRLVEEFRAAMPEEIRITALGRDDTLSREIILGAVLLMIDLSEDDMLAERLSHFIESNAPPFPVFALGVEKISESVLAMLPMIRLMRQPIDYSYLRGAIETAQFERQRMHQMDKEQNRIKNLYDLSSALLKVTSRRHLPRALENSLNKILDASLVLLSFPTHATPLVFFHSMDDMGELKLAALREHLDQSWKVLRPDAPASWEWLRMLKSERSGRNEHRIHATSFTTTPITRGNEIEGFLTMLPRGERMPDESYLQTFFMIGDLLSVLIHNLHLKEKLEQRATHDGLTKLLNRQTVIEYLDRECRRSQRYQTPVSLIMMDIDHFKLVNDRYGHQAGDEALRHTAETIKSSIREMDSAGRCGGEEFLIILPNTDSPGALIWAERLRLKLMNSSVELPDDVKIAVTASFGVATGVGSATITDELIARADAALYDAKHQGRNRVVLAERLEKKAQQQEAE